MNKDMASFIQDNLEEIIARWQELMKEDSEERFFQIMSQDVIDKTSREFAELMISNLYEGETNYENRLKDFTNKVVRFGWSISFVMKAITHFTTVVYNMLEENGTIREDNMKVYVIRQCEMESLKHMQKLGSALFSYKKLLCKNFQRH